MRIGFDLDGVLADFTTGYRFLLEQVIGKPLPDADPLVWEWPAALGVTREQETEAWERIHKANDFWRALPSMPDFTHTVRMRLRNLAADHDVYFITDRPTRSAKHQTEAWLIERELPPSVLITPHKGLACKVLNLDSYIDDKPSNCIDASVMGVTQVYLQRRSWNTQFDPGKQIVPVAGLPEFFDKENL